MTLPLWAGHGLYEVELDGEIVDERTEVIASRAQLIRRIETWAGAMFPRQ